MPDDGDMDVISKLHEVDPVFREVVDLLFGEAVDAREAYDIAKMSDPSEVHVNGAGKRRKSEKALAATGIGLGTVAGVAGAHGLYRTLKNGEGAVLRPKLLKEALKTKGGRLSAAAGLGWTALHTAEIGGDALGVHANTKVYRRQDEALKKAASTEFTEAVGEIIKARRAGQIDTETAIRLASELAETVEKSMLRPAARFTQDELKAGNRAVSGLARKVTYGVSAAGGAGAGAVVGGKVADHKTKKELLTKADDELVEYAFTGEISKMDSEKRLAFGWCSLSTVDGQPVVDLQGDYAPIEEIEKSAYAYVKDSRVGGDMHTRDGERPRHTSDLVESFIATPEKLMRMGLSEEVAKSMPSGWWVGFKINDDDQWQMVKDGRRAGFSIHGKGSRVQKALDS